jgi:hypothetical protein
MFATCWSVQDAKVSLNYPKLLIKMFPTRRNMSDRRRKNNKEERITRGNGTGQERKKERTTGAHLADEVPVY